MERNYIILTVELMQITRRKVSSLKKLIFITMCAVERSEKGIGFNMEDKKEKLPSTRIQCNSMYIENF